MGSEQAPLHELCELVVDCPHSTPKWTKAGKIVLRNQNIRNGRLDLSSPSFTDAQNYHQRIRRAKPQQGDIIITREAPMGEVCEIPADLECCLGQRMVLLRPEKSECIPRYLLYALQSSQVRHEILVNEGTGSTVSNLRIPLLKDLTIPLFPLKEQQAIAAILGALDDKIELNRRMNRTLEGMARALFKSWFVDFDPVRAKAAGQSPPGLKPEIAALFPDSFEDSELGVIPKGWKVGRLGDIALEARDAVSPAQIHHETPYIGLEHIPKKCLSLDDWGVADGVASGKLRFNAGDILFGKLRPYFHKVGPSPIDGVCSTDIVVARSRTDYFYGLVLGHMSDEAFIAYTDRGSSGTRMPRTKWRDMANYPIVVPSPNASEKFTAISSPFLTMIRESILKSRTLASLRDALLPKLISGELRVPDAERIVGRVV